MDMRSQQDINNQKINARDTSETNDIFFIFPREFF